MGLVEKNSLLAGVHGSIGNLTIVHQKARIVARNKPKVKPKPTRARKAHWSKFRQASKWASDILDKAPELAAIYREAVKGSDLSAQQLIISDFMHGPVIDNIDLSGYTGRSGETIGVEARDGSKLPVTAGLASARVVIRNLANAVLEQGDAMRKGTAWEYVTQMEVPPTQIVKVEVTAVDRPGKRATKSVPHLTRTEG